MPAPGKDVGEVVLPVTRGGIGSRNHRDRTSRRGRPRQGACGAREIDMAIIAPRCATKIRDRVGDDCPHNASGEGNGLQRRARPRPGGEPNRFSVRGEEGSHRALGARDGARGRVAELSHPELGDSALVPDERDATA